MFGKIRNLRPRHFNPKNTDISFADISVPGIPVQKTQTCDSQSFNPEISLLCDPRNVSCFKFDALKRADMIKQNVEMFPKFQASFISHWKLRHSFQLKSACIWSIEVRQFSQSQPELVNFTVLLGSHISQQSIENVSKFTLRVEDETLR